MKHPSSIAMTIAPSAMGVSTDTGSLFERSVSDKCIFVMCDLANHTHCLGLKCPELFRMIYPVFSGWEIEVVVIFRS